MLDYSRYGSLARTLLVVSINLGVALYSSGCDSGVFSPPSLEIFHPAAVSPPDTLLIGESFRISAFAYGEAIESITFRLTYNASGVGSDLLAVEIENPLRSDSFSVDTNVILQADVQPSEVIGRPAFFEATVHSEGGTGGIGFPIVLAIPEPGP